MYLLCSGWYSRGISLHLYLYQRVSHSPSISICTAIRGPRGFISLDLTAFRSRNCPSLVPPAVESSITVEDAVENRSLGSKRTNGGFGLQDPKTAEMPTKQGKTQQDQNWPESVMTGIDLELDKNHSKTRGKKTPKDKWFHFHAATPPSWDFNIDPPPPPGTSNSPFPLPGQKEIKIFRHVHQGNLKMLAHNCDFAGCSKNCSRRRRESRDVGAHRSECHSKL